MAHKVLTSKSSNKTMTTLAERAQTLFEMTEPGSELENVVADFLQAVIAVRERDKKLFGWLLMNAQYQAMKEANEAVKWH